jgi:hypothetical protein
MFIQLIALLLASSGWPLAAKYPQPPESQAVRVMLAVQLAGSAMLFPYLLRGWRAAFITIAAAWPMLLLASLLAVVAPRDVIPAASYVSAWVLTLAVWRLALPSRSAQMIGCALASLYILGGSFSEYLHSEFGTAGSTGGVAVLHRLTLVLRSPLYEFLASGDRAHVSAAPWIALAVMLILGLGLCTWYSINPTSVGRTYPDFA